VVARFGILWRPLKVPTFSFSKIILSIFLIHKCLKDENENAVPSSLQDYTKTRDAFKAWWRMSGTETGDIQGRRRDLEKSSMRDELINLLRSRGDKRPEI
jgi:hypothetical protein